MHTIMNEVTPLEPLDFFYVGERHKLYFDYPAHCHAEFEINYVENAAGARRTIGDSVETIGNYDLVLMTGAKLVHVWEQGKCPERDIFEVTIHLSPDVLSGNVMDKRHFSMIRRMFDRAQRGLAFPESVAQLVRADILALARDHESFDAVLRLLGMLYRLSLVEDARVLSSDSFTEVENQQEDQRVKLVRDYIAANYNKDVRLAELAKMVCMTPEAFSRFFTNKTGKTPSRYIIDYRLGVAAKMLLNTDQSVSAIGFSCGFNTLSHFNRLFREIKGCTPSEFRSRF